jgi:ribosomal protein S18 acetylase RimI-like enzyme
VEDTIDLRTVRPAELESLWEREVQLWRERLFWDVSERVATLRQGLMRHAVQGVALRIQTQIVGYAYYVTSGHLGVIAGFDIAPDWVTTDTVETLLKASIQELQKHDITRIESPFISFDSSGLSLTFEAEGFRTYWREFLRIHIDRGTSLSRVPPRLRLEPWQSIHLTEAAELMQAAYGGEIDTEISWLYRTVGGCRLVLDDLINQCNSGVLVAQASAFVCHGEQEVGFIVITQISPRQGHLAQVVVLPDYQGQGVGQLLVNHSISQLASLGFETLSLIVSHGNERAIRLYRSMGFDAVLKFPVFARDL